jgi:putative DNA primase/helicase
VAQSLVGVAQSVKILALPGLPPKGDVSDWIADGGIVDALELQADKAPGIGTLDADDIDMPVEFSEDSLARAFTAIHTDAFRFVSAWGKWFKWTDTHWTEEKTLEVFDLVPRGCQWL